MLDRRCKRQADAGENTALQTYSFGGKDFRVIVEKDDPWFVAKDATYALDMTDGGETYRRLGADERMTWSKSELLAGTNRSLTTEALQTLFPGSVGRVVLTSESGLYKLIMRSDKPAARKFQDWVTREVLPSPWPFYSSSVSPAAICITRTAYRSRRRDASLLGAFRRRRFPEGAWRAHRPATPRP